LAPLIIWYAKFGVNVVRIVQGTRIYW